MRTAALTNRCRQRGMAAPVPLRGSRHLVPRAAAFDVSLLDAHPMRKRTTLWIVVTVALCLGSFIVGWLIGSHGVITYSVNGWPTSFNRAWPTYGLPLAEDRALLIELHNKATTNAISNLEADVDIAVYDALCGRLHLQGRDREILDSALVQVARYREQYPRTIDKTPTNWVGNSHQLQQYEDWLSEHIHIQRSGQFRQHNEQA